MMKVKRFVTSVLILACGLVSGLSAQQTPTVNFWTRMANDELAAKITDEMTDSELLSQTFMFGWAGAEPPELLYQWVERGLGSVKVFGWNTDDIYLVAKSITGLQTQAAEGRFQIPLFVATDQEGGT